MRTYMHTHTRVYLMRTRAFRKKTICASLAEGHVAQVVYP